MSLGWVGQEEESSEVSGLLKSIEMGSYCLVLGTHRKEGHGKLSCLWRLSGSLSRVRMAGRETVLEETCSRGCIAGKRAGSMRLWSRVLQEMLWAN